MELAATSDHRGYDALGHVLARQGETAFSMEQDTPTDVRVSADDAIDALELSVRPLNALKRANIETVGELIRLVETRRLREIRNIGPKSCNEITDTLEHVQIVQPPVQPSPSAELLSRGAVIHWTVTERQIAGSSTLPCVDVVRWHAGLIEKQAAGSLLHKQAKIAGHSIDYWLSAINVVDCHPLYAVLARILGASINVCHEISLLLAGVPTRQISVLMYRCGYENRTLEDIGAEIGLTRERVRQISEALRRRLEARAKSAVRMQSVGDAPLSSSLLRIQSALLIAKDMGLGITHRHWERGIRSSGLVGHWDSDAYESMDPVEAMLAICNLLAEDKIRELRVPANLQDAVSLASSGTPDLPANVLHLRRTLPQSEVKLINRHRRFTGTVNARWLADEVAKGLPLMKDTLRALGCRPVSEEWYVPDVGGGRYRISNHDVFHHALRKMSRYCGPLPIGSICSGVRYAVSRTQFPVPPPDVMEHVLRTYGYAVEEGLSCWDGNNHEDLSTGEQTIMSCLQRLGPVVHHSELAQAFIDSELTIYSLHATLQHSPLFERIKPALYGLRGVPVTDENMKRAEVAGQPIPAEPEVVYHKSGSITVSVTLGVMSVGTGNILCEQFPNLSGEWHCFVRGQPCPQLEVTENEFRGLTELLEKLDCQTGDRLKFTFNTWDRSVEVEMVVRCADR